MPASVTCPQSGEHVRLENPGACDLAQQVCFLPWQQDIGVTADAIDCAAIGAREPAQKRSARQTASVPRVQRIPLDGLGISSCFSLTRHLKISPQAQPVASRRSNRRP